MFFSNSSMFMDPKSFLEPPMLFMNSSNVSECTNGCRVREKFPDGLPPPPPVSFPKLLKSKGFLKAQNKKK